MPTPLTPALPSGVTAEDEAQLVREQLEKLQELARLTGDAVCAQRALLCGLGTVSTEPSPPASLGARLELAGAASECQALKDQEQVFGPSLLPAGWARRARDWPAGCRVSLPHLLWPQAGMAGQLWTPGRQGLPRMTLLSSCS